MAGFRFSLVVLTALILTPVVRSQPQAAPAAPAQGAINKVYSLADLGDDPNLCKWIAETIPQMIKPGCWNGQNLCYYAPAKVMAIHQTPQIHAQVEEFLANLRKSASRPKHDPKVTQAQFVPDAVGPVGPGSASQAYPVPAALTAPKHLFHFIIRYEGEGIIDSNVTKFAEAMSKASSVGESQTRWDSSLPPTMPVPPPPPPGALTPSSYQSGVMMMPAVTTQAMRRMPSADQPTPPEPLPEPLPIEVLPAPRRAP